MAAIKHIFCIACISVCTAFVARSQNETDSTLMLSNIYGLLREDSLQSGSFRQSSVAGFREEDIRETPGAIQVITNEQIRAMGASDLIDVLNAIPGIALCRDVDDVIGIGMRGLWAHEGKVLFMLNGIPLNELDFGTYALGSRLSMDNISRIEIMNGPGSVIYGGLAALGVINIVTKSALESSGTYLTAETNYSKGYSSGNSIHLISNQQIGEQTYMTIQAFAKNSLRSTWKETLGDGQTLSYGDSTRINNQSIYIGLSRQNFRSQVYLNNYMYEVSDASYGIMMFGAAWDNQWQKRLGLKDNLKIRVTYQYQLPWFNLNSTDPEITQSNTISQKLQTSVGHEHKFNSHFTLNSGIQLYRQSGRIFDSGLTYYINDENTIVIDDIAAYSEMNYTSRAGIIKLGGRVEKNSLSETLFSPRFTYNKIFNRFYTKFLYSNAFKIPTLQNVNFGPDDIDVKHETVQSLEITLGFANSTHSNFEIAGFHTGIVNPIVYASDTIQYDNYLNRPSTGTHGIEARFMSSLKKMTVSGGACFYRVNANTDVPEMEVYSDHREAYLALPRFRASGQMLLRFSKNLSASCAVVVQGKNYSYERSEIGDGSTELMQHKSEVLIHTGIQFTPEHLNALRMRIGVNNLTDAKYYVSSPAVNGPGSMPVLARQFYLQLQYRINS